MKTRGFKHCGVEPATVTHGVQRPETENRSRRHPSREGNQWIIRTLKDKLQKGGKEYAQTISLKGLCPQCISKVRKNA